MRRRRAGGRVTLAAQGATREWAQCGGVISTCAGRAVGVGAAAGVGAKTCPKEAEQEESATRVGAVNVVDQRTCAWRRLSQKGGRGRGGRARGGREGGRGAAGGARRDRRAREDEGNWGWQTNLPGWQRDAVSGEGKDGMRSYQERRSKSNIDSLW